MTIEVIAGLAVGFAAGLGMSVVVFASIVVAVARQKGRGR